nr:TPA_asm: L1 [Manis pentadactyla papillomavirus 1]
MARVGISVSSPGGTAGAASTLFMVSLQMALWLPNTNKVYLPPAAVSKVVSTDEYVTRTRYFYHGSSSRLLTVGHPYYPITNGGTEVVPKVSGNQFRVFRVKLPDPNLFGVPDLELYDPDKERLVWACVGLEVGRGQPLGIGLSGGPLLNRFDDTENPTRYNPTPSTDNRQNVSVDNKQSQLILLGNAPPMGEHWGRGLRCADNPAQAGDCPPLELVSSILEDGDMIDTGFGAMDFKVLQEDKSDVPLDISSSVCKYPDYIRMCAEQYGDDLFFFVRREQMFTRHFFSRAGQVGESVPDALIFKATEGQAQATLAPSVYFGTPSGSLVSSDSQIFNRPYWLQKAQGLNNGICWDNELFLTVVDTTRSTNLTLSVQATKEDTYKASNFKQYMRHCEEFDLQFIFQLCKVSLSPENLAYLNSMNPDILDTWNLGLSSYTVATIEDKYRYESSLATRCPDRAPPKERVDRYAKYKFWVVDLSSMFSSELEQFPLGRKFILQTGIGRAPVRRPVKRTAKGSTAVSRKRARR